jgi:hypothetical protein
MDFLKQQTKKKLAGVSPATLHVKTAGKKHLLLNLQRWND